MLYVGICLVGKLAGQECKMKHTISDMAGWGCQGESIHDVNKRSKKESLSSFLTGLLSGDALSGMALGLT